MEILSVRDYRNNLASYFDRASEGERVVIRRKNNLYALVNIGKEDVALSPKKEKRLAQLTQSIRKSWNEVKRIEAGLSAPKSAISFLDEL